LNKVTLLIAAVASHKFVVGFCLGVELCANQSARSRNHFKAITVFSLGSVLGIGLGMGLDGIGDAWKTTVLPALQALVGGTLLYVTVCEVLPREKARWHQNRVFPGAGLVQLVSVIVGFAVMCSLTKLLSKFSA
jgi:solute carrier family 39 (zinc transporter), member 1/2/3